MGDAYFNLGQFEDAEQSYRKSLEFGEELYSTAGLVCIFSERKDWESAAHFFGLLIAGAADTTHQIEILLNRFDRTGQRQVMLELFNQIIADVSGSQKVVALLEEQLERFS